MIRNRLPGQPDRYGVVVCLSVVRVGWLDGVLAGDVALG
jgi:hypothetical protein